MFTTEATKTKRMSICTGCKDIKHTLVGKQCGVCKCQLTIKVMFTAQSCPKKLW